MSDFKRMRCWQKSHRFTLEVYQLTASFPKEEMYGLTSQMRRSSVSIPTNLAEGSGRNSLTELRRFLIIAAGSAAELEYQILLSYELYYIDRDVCDHFTTSINFIQKMLFNFIKRIQQKLLENSPGVTGK